MRTPPDFKDRTPPLRPYKGSLPDHPFFEESGSVHNLLGHLLLQTQDLDLSIQAHLEHWHHDETMKREIPTIHEAYRNYTKTLQLFRQAHRRMTEKLLEVFRKMREEGEKKADDDYSDDRMKALQQLFNELEREIVSLEAAAVPAPPASVSRSTRSEREGSENNESIGPKQRERTKNTFIDESPAPREDRTTTTTTPSKPEFDYASDYASIAAHTQELRDLLIKCAEQDELRTGTVHPWSGLSRDIPITPDTDTVPPLPPHPYPHGLGPGPGPGMGPNTSSNWWNSAMRPDGETLAEKAAWKRAERMRRAAATAAARGTLGSWREGAFFGRR